MQITTNLTATVVSNGTITLSWDASGDESVTGYQILRRRPREGEKGVLVYVTDSAGTDTSYTDANVPAGTLYVYRVKGINGAGVGEESRFPLRMKSSGSMGWGPYYAPTCRPLWA